MFRHVVKNVNHSPSEVKVAVKYTILHTVTQLMCTFNVNIFFTLSENAELTLIVFEAVCLMYVKDKALDHST